MISVSRRSRFLYILAASTLIYATPLGLAQSNDLPPATPSSKPLAFTIVSIKQHGKALGGGVEGCYVDGCHFADRPLLAFIMIAYNLSQIPILGNPLPGDSDLFDLDAKIDPADLPTSPLTSRQLANLLQPVLADRFQLRVHRETRTIPVYKIVVAKGGLKMKESVRSAPLGLGGPTSPAVSPSRGCFPKSVGDGLRIEHDCTMNDLGNILEGPTGRYVVDKTGVIGRFDFELHWAPDDTPTDSPLIGGPSIFTAVQDQLGIKLEPSTAPIDVLVIDSAQKPTPN